MPISLSWFMAILIYGGISVVVLAMPQAWAFDVQLSTDIIKQGETLAVQIDEATSPVLQCRIAAQQIPVFSTGMGYARALIGFSASAAVGRRTLVVTRQRGIQKIPFRVQGVPMGKEPLHLPKQKRKLYADPNVPRQQKRVRQVVRTVTPTQWWEGLFRWPVEGEIITPYGKRRVVNGRPQQGYHRGIDLRAPRGAPVYAANSGTVCLAEPLVLHGNTVLLDHGQGVITMYLHLEHIGVTENQQVKKGDVIGTVGSTGVSTAPHLHWGLYVHGVPVDPTQWTRHPF